MEFAKFNDKTLEVTQTVKRHYDIKRLKLEEQRLQLQLDNVKNLIAQCDSLNIKL